MPIYHRLALVTVSSVLIFSLVIIAVFLWGAQRYQQELAQNLNADIAQYIIDHQKQPLIDEQGRPNTPLLKDLAMHAMMINPLIEVYLLDNDGNILGHALHTQDVKLDSVDLQPINRSIQNQSEKIVLGDNPRFPQRKQIFSVAQVESIGGNKGYLYVVLESKASNSLSEVLLSSYIFRLVLIGIFFIVLLFLTVSLFSFYRVTKPIRSLENKVRNFQKMVGNSEVDLAEISEKGHRDELSVLESSFESMQSTIDQQIAELKNSDRLRRELISNISHDLRTPIASIQGYIETLILKDSDFSGRQKSDYLHTALKHCKRLTRLIASLFELSKLDSAAIKAEPEVFSITELAHDIVQDFQLSAETKRIDLALDEKTKNLLVKADIAMMERVFQNLIDNAIRHTPEQGEIRVSLNDRSGRVEVCISDTGDGINEKDLPYVFDRYYHRSEQDGSQAVSSGLGLAIVKRIIELHGSFIEVTSEISRGTRFSFSLNTATP